MVSPYSRICSLLGGDGLPEKWELIRDVLILDTEDERVAETYARVLRARSVIRQVSIDGELRRVKSALLWGDPKTETVYKENRILYKIDPARIMLSSGNKEERIRMSEVSNPDEICLDMFAGIGYFALPLALRSKMVYAIEKDPLAFKYLLENVKLNGFKNVTPLLGDCRDVKLPCKVDRVVMGYLHSYPFLDRALNSIDDEGVIHYHGLYRTGDMETPIRELEGKANQQGFEVKPLLLREVKSYGPKTSHMVVDGMLRRRLRGAKT
jgi:tRNA wybutosine-synthesizing protein 2